MCGHGEHGGHGGHISGHGKHQMRTPTLVGAPASAEIYISCSGVASALRDLGGKAPHPTEPPICVASDAYLTKKRHEGRFLPNYHDMKTEIGM